uniref:De novo design protein 312 parent n=1 Tax=synthetic construct TaxID=32630 RepID=UPI0034E05770
GLLTREEIEAALKEAGFTEEEIRKVLAWLERVGGERKVLKVAGKILIIVEKRAGSRLLLLYAGRVIEKEGMSREEVEAIKQLISAGATVEEIEAIIKRIEARGSHHWGSHHHHHH